MALREMRQVTNLLAEKKYAEAMKQVDKVLGLDPEVDFYFQVNELCWDGTLNGQASRVLRACDIAVERSRGRKNGWMMRDNRGIARALTNNAAGAIEDFEYAIHNVDSIDSADFKVTRQSWVDALKAGNHPFSEELLNSLH